MTEHQQPARPAPDFPGSVTSGPPCRSSQTQTPLVRTPAPALRVSAAHPAGQRGRAAAMCEAPAGCGETVVKQTSLPLLAPRLLRSSAHVAAVTMLLSPCRWFVGRRPRPRASEDGGDRREPWGGWRHPIQDLRKSLRVGTCSGCGHRTPGRNCGRSGVPQHFRQTPWRWGWLIDPGTYLSGNPRSSPAGRPRPRRPGFFARQRQHNARRQ